MARCFVYGTLMPGHLRWPMLEPHATHCVPAAVRGRLFDTGYGWPAAAFAIDIDCHNGGDRVADATIPGWVVEVPDEREQDLLDLLDHVETGFGRVRVATLDGDEAWSYEVPEPDPRWVAIDRWSDEDER